MEKSRKTGHSYNKSKEETDTDCGERPSHQFRRGFLLDNRMDQRIGNGKPHPGGGQENHCQRKGVNDGKSPHKDTGDHESIPDPYSKESGGKYGQEDRGKKHADPQCRYEHAKRSRAFMKTLLGVYGKQDIQGAGDQTIKGHDKKEREKVVLFTENDLEPFGGFPEKQSCGQRGCRWGPADMDKNQEYCRYQEGNPIDGHDNCRIPE